MKPFLTMMILVLTAMLACLISGTAVAQEHSIVYDVAILNDRVMDPETGFDALANVGIQGGLITKSNTDEIAGKYTIDDCALSEQSDVYNEAQYHLALGDVLIENSLMAQMSPSLLFASMQGDTSKTAAGEGGGALSAEQAAKELANPNTSLASLNFKNTFTFYEGDLPDADSQVGYTLLFQPAFPFPINSSDKIIFRPAIPFQFSQPVFNAGAVDFHDKAGIGDIGFDLIYAKSGDDGLLLGVGIVGTIPTASHSELGGGRWLVGPEFFLGKISEQSVIGIFPSHQWDVAGWGDESVSITSIQPILTYLPGGGWSVGTAPTLKYDWIDEQWTVPINLNVGKTVTVDSTVWKIGVEVNYFVENSDAFAPEWTVLLNLTPVVENFLAGLFN
jgi:hypothetical protein